ncbi:LysM peptidoglycan-binding domain-containing protein [Sorangium sp. So ce375]|uniref:CIS tube protein n=1 Tax=Sorangium sp. So ce375 TaxID=3133306 RepID=UPI003F5CACDF
MSADKTVEKLTIYYEQKKGTKPGEVKVGFNPAQLAFSTSATWEHVEPTLGSTSASSGMMVFRSVAPETLTLNLFFDTYAPYPSDSAGGMLAAAAASMASSVTSLVGGSLTPPESVVKKTDEVMALMRVNAELHRPPKCQLMWGKSTLFHGVLQRANRTYTLFMPDGTPVRATMECTFMEVVGSNRVELHSADVAKVYVVRAGDTLMGIAAEHYGDGGHWRLIADENGIENPRALVPGRTLAIPKVR